MQVFTMVFLIVAVSCLTAVVIEYLKHRRHGADRNRRTAELESRVEAMNERIAALEAIVTDEGYRLNQEIGALKRSA